MTDSTIPQPGPAKLKRNAGPDEWLEAAKDCKYLSEAHMKQLCEIVKEFMMEGELLFWICGVMCVLGANILCVPRVEYSARIDPGYHLRRYPRSILRSSRTLSSFRRNAKRVSC
jgi:hypothetical protein